MYSSSGLSTDVFPNKTNTNTQTNQTSNQSTVFIPSDMTQTFDLDW